jgi:translation initiation factor SUI1
MSELTDQDATINSKILNFKDNLMDDFIEEIEASIIHIRLQKRSGKKSITTISGLKNPKNSMVEMRKKFSCGGSVVSDDIVQLQGDLRKEIHAHLIAAGMSSTYIFIHGY